jgi:AraC-like DNA-binding protein
MGKSSKPLFSQNPIDTIAQLQDTFFPPYITLAHLFHAPSSWGIRSRILHQYQLQYVVNGVAEYRIGEQLYVTKTGDLVFHRPGEHHAVHTVKGEPYVCLSIVFHFGTQPFPIDVLLTSAHHMGNYHNTEVERKLTQLVVQYQQPGVDHRLRSQALLLEVLADLKQNVGQFGRIGVASDPIKTTTTAKMALAKKYIAEHYREPLSIGDLQAITHLSQDYLIERFKLTVGMTPIQYQIHLRVEKAKELAVQEGLSVSEIAHYLGYADVHTFGRMFKKKTGSSLSQFCSTLFTDAPSHDETLTE